MERMISILTLMALVLLTCIAVYVIYRDMIVRKEKQDFDMQMIMAQSKAKVTTSYDDAFKIIDKMLIVSTTTKINSLNLRAKTAEQLSVILDDVIIEVSTHVLMNISDALKRQLYNYISEEYLTKYVTDNCRRLLVIHIEGSNISIPKEDKKI